MPRAGRARASAVRSRTPGCSPRSPSTRPSPPPSSAGCRWATRCRPPSTCPTPIDSEHAVGRRVDELVELLGLGPYRVAVRRRAVDRHPPGRRPGLPAGPPPEGGAPRRAGLRHRPARGRGAGAAHPPHPRRDRRQPSWSSSTTSRWSSRSSDRLVAMDQGRVRGRRHARPTCSPTRSCSVRTWATSRPPSTAPAQPAQARSTRRCRRCFLARSRSLRPSRLTMQPVDDNEPDSRPSALRRFGPITAVLLVIVIVAAVSLVGSGGDDDEGDGQRHRRGRRADRRAARGRRHLVDGAGAGPRRHLPRHLRHRVGQGRDPVLLPHRVHRRVRRRQRRRHGARASPATRSRSSPGCPTTTTRSSSSCARRSGSTTSVDDVRETYEGLVEIFQTYYQTYGRTVDLEFVQASGSMLDPVAARADALPAPRR